MNLPQARIDTRERRPDWLHPSAEDPFAPISSALCRGTRKRLVPEEQPNVRSAPVPQ